MPCDSPGREPAGRWRGSEWHLRAERSRESLVQISATSESHLLPDPPELSGAAPPNRASRATIPFLESDRPGPPRAGDAYGDIWITRLPAPARSPSRECKSSQFGPSDDRVAREAVKRSAVEQPGTAASVGQHRPRASALLLGLRRSPKAGLARRHAEPRDLLMQCPLTPPSSRGATALGSSRTETSSARTADSARRRKPSHPHAGRCSLTRLSHAGGVAPLGTTPPSSRA